MAAHGKVTYQRSSLGTAAGPGPQTTVTDLIEEYPELAGPLLATVAWRDVGNYDRHDKDFERKFPSLRPW